MFQYSSKPVVVKTLDCDTVGPPDPVSNLRTVIFHKRKNEHPIECEFRRCREDVQKWNQEFWTKHNLKFIKV